MSWQGLKKYLLLFSIFIILFAGFLFLQGTWKSSKKEKDRPWTVKVKRGEVVSKILGTGTVAPFRQINIYSKRGGRVIEVRVDEGDFVARGETLLLLDKEEALSGLKQAKANLRGAEAETQQAKIRLEYARSNLETCQELFKKALIARYELEQAKRDYELAKIQLSAAYSSRLYAAQESYSLSLDAIEDTIIKAPISGIVVKKGVVEDEVITPGARPLIMQDLSQIVIKTEINEIDINKIKWGQEVEIDFDAIRGSNYHGVVSKIAPAGNLKGNIVTYEVEIKLVASDARIKPGMTCNVSIIVAKAENILYLPVDTVKREGDKSFVLLKKEDNFIWKKEVNIGVANENYVVIEKGLKEGDEVKIFRQERWEEGTEDRALSRSSRDFK